MLSSHGSFQIVNFVVDGLTKKIIAGIKSGIRARTIPLSSAYVDDRAQLHCDKWIEETSFHISKYSAAKKFSDKPPLTTPSSGSIITPDVSRLIIHYKAFSGDVSGVIGEAIFSCILVQEFGLKDEYFAHFRADKQSGIFPDFGIFFLSSKLKGRLEWDKVSVAGGIVPAEVKTVTSANVTEIKPKLIKAVGQVQNFWVRVNGGVATGAGHSGIVCLAVRNQHLGAYDIALIWGK